MASDALCRQGLQICAGAWPLPLFQSLLSPGWRLMQSRDRVCNPAERCAQPFEVPLFNAQSMASICRSNLQRPSHCSHGTAANLAMSSHCNRDAFDAVTSTGLTVQQRQTVWVLLRRDDGKAWLGSEGATCPCVQLNWTSSSTLRAGSPMRFNMRKDASADVSKCSGMHPGTQMRAICDLVPGSTSDLPRQLRIKHACHWQKDGRVFSEF